MAVHTHVGGFAEMGRRLAGLCGLCVFGALRFCFSGAHRSSLFWLPAVLLRVEGKENQICQILKTRNKASAWGVARDDRAIGAQLHRVCATGISRS